MPVVVSAPKHYLRKSAVQTRYGGTSAMWIKRRIAADNFPLPAMHVGASPLWLVSDLDAWDAMQAAKGKPEPRCDMTPVRAARQVRS